MPTTTRDRRTRPRRGSILDTAPEQLAQWFAGEIQDTLYRLLPYEVEMLGVRWRSYKATHPDAVPPPNYAWLDNPSDPRHATPEEVRTARKMLMRDLV